jgi:hypothetical protein
VAKRLYEVIRRASTMAIINEFWRFHFRNFRPQSELGVTLVTAYSIYCILKSVMVRKKPTPRYTSALKRVSPLLLVHFIFVL